MRDFFVDKLVQKQYEDDGYFKVRLLPADAVSALLENGRQYVEYREGFYSMLHDGLASYQKRKEMSELIWAQYGEAVNSIFIDFIPMRSTFINKTHGKGSYIPPHQDWTMLDERKFRSFNVWMPLIPTTKDNGALHVVPGTHRLHDNPRACPTSILSYPEQRHVDMLLKHGVIIETEPGEAIIFDNKVMHYSLPNLTDTDRIVAGSTMVPAEAPTFHYCYNREGRKGIYDLCKVDVESFLTLDFEEFATKTEVIGQVPIPDYPDPDKELRDLFYPSIYTRLKKKFAPSHKK